MVSHLPPATRGQAAQLPPKATSAPEYFGVLANSINIMLDHITRTRLAGEPPHAMLLPRLRDMGLMEFDQAKETIAEGRICVEQALRCCSVT
jgi:NTE family protein